MPYIGNPIYQSAFVTDQFSGTGSQTAYTMSVAPAGTTNVLVVVSGVVQDPSTYGVVGNTLTFSAAPPSGTGNISCRYLGVPVTGVTTTAYRTKTEFTATAGQTTFTPPSYTVGYIDVFLNGVLLASSDYTASNGTTVVLTTGASAGNILTTESFYVSSVLNAIPNTPASVGSSNIQASVALTTPTMTSPTISSGPLTIGTTALGAGNASIMKNRLINGNMYISQRNGTTATNVTTNAQYTLDRWCSQVSQSSKFTVTQSTTAPAGFNNSALITSSSAYTVGAAELFTFEQRIEAYNTADLGWGTADAKTVTLSFWVRSSLTGTFGGVLQSYISNRTYPFTYTISAANTWEQKSITVAGDTTGSWSGASNSGGIVVEFGLGVGSTLSGTAGAWSGTQYFSATGATSVVGTNGATWYITGVQLEVGSSATGFEYVNYQTSLANCQRYYKQYADGTSSLRMALAENVSTTRFDPVFSFGVPMRATPSVTYSAVGDFISYSGNNARTCTSIAMDIANATSCNLICNVASGLTAAGCSQFASQNTNARLGLSAEL